MAAELKEAPVSDAAFIWNFFARKLMKIETATVVKAWAAGGGRIAEYHKDDGNYISTHLHEGVFDYSHFTIINFAAFKDFTALPFKVATDHEAYKKIVGGGPPPVPAVPGGFREIKRLSRTPEKPSMPKLRPNGTIFIVAVYVFQDDLKLWPSEEEQKNGVVPGTRFASSDAITKARGEFEADWQRASGAHLLARHGAVSEIYLYQRETHGMASFVLRAECGLDVAPADEAAKELKSFLVESEWLKERNWPADVDIYKVVVDGDPKGMKDNVYGVV